MLNLFCHLLLALPGALFGAALGFWLVVEVQDPLFFFGVIAASTIVCGVLSIRLGLPFWEQIGKARWLPWL
jgi:hypothetical protein